MLTYHGALTKETKLNVKTDTLIREAMEAQGYLRDVTANLNAGKVAGNGSLRKGDLKAALIQAAHARKRCQEIEGGLLVLLKNAGVLLPSIDHYVTSPDLAKQSSIPVKGKELTPGYYHERIQVRTDYHDRPRVRTVVLKRIFDDGDLLVDFARYSEPPATKRLPATGFVRWTGKHGYSK